MIGFDLTDEQCARQREAREVAENTLRPAGLALDRTFDGERFRTVLSTLVRAGYTSMIIPQEYGGVGLDNLTTAIVLEEMAVGCAGIASTLAASFHAASALLIAGTPEQRRQFLPLLVQPGGGLAAMAITEHEAGGSDILGLRTKSHREDDGYVLSGVKCFVTNAGFATFYVILATEDPRLGRAGIGAFLVPRDAAGLSVTRVEDTMGMRSSPVGEIELRELRLPSTGLMGHPGSGYLAAMQTLDRGRAFYGAISVGIGRAAYEVALDFAKREQRFGVPIFRHQAVAFSLADMATEIDAARFLVWRACWLMGREEDYTRVASMAKLCASETALRAAAEAVQILGKYGYSRDHPLEKIVRDANAMRIMEGTNHIQRAIIATQL